MNNNRICLTVVILLSIFLVTTLTPANAKIERHFVFDSAHMNLEEIIESSNRIFSGVCTSSEEIENDSESGGLPTVKYTFKTSDGIKGVKDQDEVIFKQWEPTTRANGYDCTGDKKYVLFLYPDSNRGLTSSVGVDQGLFEVVKEGFIVKKEVVSNKLNNLGIAKNLKTQKTINFEGDEALDSYVHHCSEHGKPIRYKEFIKAVRYLVEK